MKRRQVAGRYEPGNNILHLWFPDPVMLTTKESVETFFSEVIADWVQPISNRFYLLVNYTNLRIHASMADAYAEATGRFQHKVLGTFRYNIDSPFTGLAVSLGTFQLKARSNIFQSEE